MNTDVDSLSPMLDETSTSEKSKCLFLIHLVESTDSEYKVHPKMVLSSNVQ